MYSVHIWQTTHAHVTTTNYLLCEYVCKESTYGSIVLGQIKVFCHGLSKIGMLSWQLIKEVSIAVYQHLNKQAQFNVFGYLELPNKKLLNKKAQISLFKFM